MRRFLYTFLITMIIVISLTAQTQAAVTEADIKTKLQDRNTLGSIPGAINPLLSSIPPTLKNIVGTDEIIHARIESTNLEIVIAGGKVISVKQRSPTSPTKYADTDYATLTRIANANTPELQAFSEYIRGNIRIHAASGCVSETKCAANQVCHQNKCVAAYTFVATPIGYAANEKVTFENDARVEVDLMLQMLPVDRSRVRVHYVDPKVCPNNKCTDPCGNCQNIAMNCANAAGLLGAAHKVLGVTKDRLFVKDGTQQIELCGCAGGIPSKSSVTKSRFFLGGQGPYCATTMAHEAGHSLGLYHISAIGQEAGACLGPNANDCADGKKSSDIMGYNRPRDHFGPGAKKFLENLFAAVVR